MASESDFCDSATPNWKLLYHKPLPKSQVPIVYHELHYYSNMINTKLFSSIHLTLLVQNDRTIPNVKM